MGTVVGWMALAVMLLAGPAWADPVPKGAPPTAVFDVQFVNSSPADTTAEETARVARLGVALRAALARSGRYALVDMAPWAGTLAAKPAPRDCPPCALEIATRAGATVAVIAWVQKVSNLILNLNISIRDAATGQILKGGSVDIRGNTDESWDRGLRFLLEEHVLDGVE
ncbi:DUF3280 domain-containing protein [Nitrospirillum sp. BR 11164]|uniref:DUF3280 domain-containing protein n=1 Tax=Nitrospirillum sp. BR 11164 TaxID=3104324 RepID=UPI002AFE9A3F|nr:DUF3280 domain-containing protein [Nitrospirillum sp. BR 11164]MEA1650021.1 DUF3280 domain-containing protein [Nitrospirillum sp. BR 11164]